MLQQVFDFLKKKDTRKGSKLFGQEKYIFEHLGVENVFCDIEPTFQDMDIRKKSDLSISFV